MATPAEIIAMVASLQNDTNQVVYTNEACLPYLNMALDELQEIFEDNNIPVVNQVSATLTIPASNDVIIIGFSTIPALPSDLIEIQQLWQSFTGQNQWIPMARKEFLPHYLDNPPINQYTSWAWLRQQIHLPPCTQVNDIKIDYLQNIFNTPILISQVNVDLGVINTKSYLGYRTASLCSFFIGENETRAGALGGLADEALSRTLGISNKGRQAIQTRRRPFRAGYKRTQLW